MSCRRVRRELLEIVRFGDLEPSSASPHLDHLETCRGCRDDVGLDRVLVGQLRRALAARVEPYAPPTRAWYAILAEAQRPEPRVSVWAWSAAFVARLRTATAMAGTGLAVVLALNMEVIPAGAPDPVPANESEEVALLQVPRLPTGRTALVVLSNRATENLGGAERPDPEQALMQADTRLAPRSRTNDAAPEADTDAAPQIQLSVRPFRAPELDPAARGERRAAVPAVEIVDLEPGTPS
jgi:hypothetical protein